MFNKILFFPIKLMNKLPFHYKIILSFSILFLLLILPVYTLFNSFKVRNQQYNNQLMLSKYIKKIEFIVTDTQLHRGLINSYVKGNNQVKKEISFYENRINKEFLSLINYDKKSLNILRDNSQFLKALNICLTLNHNYDLNDIDKKYIFDRHSEMISDLLNLVKHISLKSFVLDGEKSKINYLSILISDKLLNLQEISAQLRGEAVEIFAHKSINSTKKAKIISKYILLNDLQQAVLEKNINIAQIDHVLKIEKTFALTLYKLGNFLDVVNSNLIKNSNLNFDSRKFFSIATDAINSQKKLFLNLLNIYQEVLAKEKHKNLVQFMWTFIGFFIIITTALYLVLVLYRSVLVSLYKLEKASTLDQNGNFYYVAPDSNDEIGRAISTLNEVHHKLDKSLAFLDGYKIAIDESSIVSKTDTRGIITYANKQFCNISGYTLDELIGKPHNIVRDPSMPKEAFKNMWMTIKSKKIWKGKVTNRRKDGTQYIVDATVMPIVDHDGNIVEYIAVRHDITELENSKEDLKRYRIDPLTQLPNKNQLLEDIVKIKRPILLYLNIDNFSQINDLYGMKIADNLLVYISSKLRDMFEGMKCDIYKYHNDEFFLLFDENVLTLDLSESLMKKILEYIEEKTKNCQGNSCVAITLRGGLAYYKSVEKENEELLISAMTAAKVAKKRNKKFLTYISDMSSDSNYKENINWIHKIKDAIKKDKITPYFQPIIDNNLSKVVKFESLVRLVDENDNPISPFFFLDIAKKAKLYTEITKIMVDKTLKVLSNFPQYEFSINLTAEDIQDSSLRDFIIQKIRDCRLSKNIILEITESESIENYELINRFINRARAYGVKVAIDDFGSGYANFDHIVSIAPDIIKIDGSLIKVLDRSSQAKIVTEAIIVFSKKLGAKTVVEYVHNEDIYNIVKNLGADFSQGFYLGEPISYIDEKKLLLTL